MNSRSTQLKGHYESLRHVDVGDAAYPGSGLLSHWMQNGRRALSQCDAAHNRHPNVRHQTFGGPLICVLLLFLPIKNSSLVIMITQKIIFRDGVLDIQSKRSLILPTYAEDMLSLPLVMIKAVN